MGTFVLDPSTHVTASVPRAKPIPKRQYIDKQFRGGESEWKKKLEKSTTVYIGNLSCYTNEYQLTELVSRCGPIKKIIMGLDKIKKTPCGFCFVEFDDRESAMRSINFLNRTLMDGREITIDIDGGFEEGRQFGRGAEGGQLGDERRRFRSQEGRPMGARGGMHGSAQILTRSITIMACLAMISILLIANHPTSVGSEFVIGGRRAYYTSNKMHLMTPSQIKIAQLGDNRPQFEEAFAQFLVNIMKAAKPTLMKAFITATLGDKQLKEIAIGIFFNSTSTDES